MDGSIPTLVFLPNFQKFLSNSFNFTVSILNFSKIFWKSPRKLILFLPNFHKLLSIFSQIYCFNLNFSKITPKSDFVLHENLQFCCFQLVFVGNVNPGQVRHIVAVSCDVMLRSPNVQSRWLDWPSSREVINGLNPNSKRLYQRLIGSMDHKYVIFDKCHYY